MKTTTANVIPPPNTPEAERRVLAAILNDPESFSEIHPDCFYQESHRQIYRAVRSEIQKGNTPDVFSISSLLPEYKEEIHEIEQLGRYDAITAARNLKFICELYETRKTLEFLKLASGKLEDGQPLGDVVPGLIADIEFMKAGPRRQALITEAVSDWIVKDIPRPVPIIPGLIDAGTKIDFSASSKGGKTWFTIQLCLCVAAGRDFLGYELFGIRRKVLVLNLENGEFGFQARVRGVMEALDISPDEIKGTFEIVNCRGKEVDFEAIGATAANVRPDLIVVDPFYKLVQGNENAADTYTRTLGLVDGIIEKTGAALLKVMHFAKGYAGDKQTGDRTVGSGILQRDYDAGISLTPHIDEGYAVLEVIHRNYAERPAQTVFLDKNKLIFFTDERPATVKTSKTAKGALSKEDKINNDEASISLQLESILKEPLAKTDFIMKLHKNGLSKEAARAYCDRLIIDETLDELNIRDKGNKKLIGYPGAIARMRAEEESKNAAKKTVKKAVNL